MSGEQRASGGREVEFPRLDACPCTQGGSKKSKWQLWVWSKPSSILKRSSFDWLLRSSWWLWVSLCVCSIWIKRPNFSPKWLIFSSKSVFYGLKLQTAEIILRVFSRASLSAVVIQLVYDWDNLTCNECQEAPASHHILELVEHNLISKNGLFRGSAFDKPKACLPSGQTNLNSM